MKWDENAETDSAKIWNFDNFEKLGFGKMINWDTKTKISIFKEFGFAKSKKSAPQNLKLDYDFEFRCRKFDFENFKIDFSNFFRISIRDPKI